MNGQIENFINYGDILLSCCIPHDLHWEHRMPAHSIIFVRSGKLVIEGRDRTDEITAGHYVFVRRDCSVNVTKVPLEGESNTSNRGCTKIFRFGAAPIGYKILSKEFLSSICLSFIQ